MAHAPQPPPNCRVPPRRAAQFAERVAIHLERGAWDMAHEVIHDAQRQIEGEAADAPHTLADVLEVNLAETVLAVRTVNTLEEKGITTVGELLLQTRADVYEIPGLGKKVMREILDMLAAYGLRAEPDEED